MLIFKNTNRLIALFNVSIANLKMNTHVSYYTYNLRISLIVNHQCVCVCVCFLVRVQVIKSRFNAWLLSH